MVRFKKDGEADWLTTVVETCPDLALKLLRQSISRGPQRREEKPTMSLFEAAGLLPQVRRMGKKPIQL